MIDDYKKKIKLNALSGYLNLFLNSFTILLISPLLVNFLGNVNFGIWKSIQRILSITSVADGRSTQALKSFIANLESDHDYDKKRRLVGSAVKVSFFFLPVTVIIVALVIYLLPTFINDIPYEYVDIVRITGFILGLNIILTPILSIPDSILVGTNNIYKLTNIQTFTMILMNVLFVGVAYFGYGILALGIISTFILLLNGIIIYVICRKNIPWFGYQKPQNDEIKGFFKYSFWVFIWMFVERITLSTEILLISYLISPVEVTNFSFCSYAVQLLVPIALLTSSAFSPSIGKFMGQQDYTNAIGIIHKLKKSLRIIALIFGIGIILFNQIFISIWVGESYYFGGFNNLLLVLITIQLLLYRNDSQIQDQTLNIKNKVLVGVIGTVLVFALAIVGYTFYPSLSTIFYSIILGRLLITVFFRIQVNRHFNIKVDFNDEIIVIFVLLITYILSHLVFNNNIYFNIAYFIISMIIIYRFLNGKELLLILIKRKTNLRYDKKRD